MSYKVDVYLVWRTMKYRKDYQVKSNLNLELRSNVEIATEISVSVYVTTPPQPPCSCSSSFSSFWARHPPQDSHFPRQQLCHYRC